MKGTRCSKRLTVSPKASGPEPVFALGATLVITVSREVRLRDITTGMIERKIPEKTLINYLVMCVLWKKTISMEVSFALQMLNLRITIVY